MTLTTAITLNAILGAAVTYGLLVLLGLGIRSDRQTRAAEVRPLERRPTSDRLAA